MSLPPAHPLLFHFPRFAFSTSRRPFPPCRFPLISSRRAGIPRSPSLLPLPLLSLPSPFFPGPSPAHLFASPALPSSHSRPLVASRSFLRLPALSLNSLSLLPLPALSLGLSSVSSPSRPFASWSLFLLQSRLLLPAPSVLPRVTSPSLPFPSAPPFSFPVHALPLPRALPFPARYSHTLLLIAFI